VANAANEAAQLLGKVTSISRTGLSPRRRIRQNAFFIPKPNKIHSGQVANAANEAAQPPGKVTNISRTGLSPRRRIRQNAFLNPIPNKKTLSPK
jgi:hypothetical protein